MYSLTKFNFYQNLIGDIKLGSMNYDFVCINKHSGRLMIFEYLKRGENQSSYITPLTSHMNRYIRQNKGKFNSFKIAQEKLNADIYYINYAFENTIVDNNGKKVDVGQMVKIMKQKDIVFGREKIVNYRSVVDDIHFETIGSFKSFKEFSDRFEKFLENNCIILNIKVPISNTDLISKEEAINFLKGKNSEYQKQQDKSRQGISYRRRLIMPDLGGEIFEDRLSFDINKYKLPIDKVFFIKKWNKFFFINSFQVSNFEEDTLFNIIKPMYEHLKEFGDNLFIFEFFNPESENIAYFRFFKENKIFKIISKNEYQDLMKEMSNLQYS